MKVWVVLLVCLNTKALKLYVGGGYSTEDFLLVWASFVADHGQPLTCHSDRGSQLVSAAKENPDMETPGYDWDMVASSMAGKTVWYFTPAQAQFRNGAVEIFVKKFKRTFEHLFKGKVMRLLEMQAAVKIVASVTNSRPISAWYGPKGGDDPDYLTAITPNMLLTGRANTEIPVRDYDETSRPLVRMQYVQQVVTEWWNQFRVQNFSSLVPTQKWQEERRNIEVGDVVLVQYSSVTKPGSYRLAKVVSVEQDEDDGLVRTCTVVYSILAELGIDEMLEYKGITRKERGVLVQRLVLILPVEEMGTLDGLVEEENKFSSPKYRSRAEGGSVEADFELPISTIFNAQVSRDISVAKEELGMMDQMLRNMQLFNVTSANLYWTGLKRNSLATHHDYLWVEYDACLGGEPLHV